LSSQTEIPGTIADVTVSSLGAASGGWTNITNAGATGASYATNSISGGGQTDSIQATNCGFSTSGTINGAQASLSRSCNANSGTSYAEDVDAFLMFATGHTPTLSANNYAATSTKYPTTAAGVTYGTGTTDTWGSAGSLTTTNVNGSSFGFLFSCVTEKSADIVSVNSMLVTIYYTAGAGGGPTNNAALIASPF
jgi:hypothetical protein